MNQEFFQRGLEKAKQKDYVGAIQDFSQELQNNPYFSQAYLKRGLAYYDSGEVHRAVSDYTEALKLDPQLIEAYYCRALARLILKNLPGTLDDVEQAIRLNSNYAAAYNLQGIVQRKQGNINQAIASFKKAAQLYLQQQDAENSRRCLESLKQLQPKPQIIPAPSPQNQPLTITSEADYFKQLIEKAENGNIREALDSLSWALQVDSEDGKAYCCRGIIRYKQENYREAIADFNQAIKFNFQDAIVYRNRGKTRLQIGDNQGAISDFNQALNIEPEETENGMTYIARGNAYRSVGNHLEAITDYNKALEINPSHAHAYIHRGLAYTHIEEMKLAINDYQKAASIFCEQEDWQNYQKVLDTLKNITVPSSEGKESRSKILQQRLLRLVGGYWGMAERLIQEAQYNYPGMSDDWYLEKVIYDIEQERGN
ncbi:tetratricopeptide repeat protein [Calothrix sp. PCC 6303]|uniref:tetratricopeptide repeat protein n=1 Tax=Calothrix sp. PCC 6303 TaxID=1170562 RepID=UPI0002A0422A|nr:tetratricopeptide repeat protein [Calothrix sp. PCC 6303]AFZ02563.1 Tetratricopeptide TPR_2 repeat-containing protein [Calothrix sp. PCC 6303]